jgi:hypothetical protein
MCISLLFASSQPLPGIIRSLAVCIELLTNKIGQTQNTGQVGGNSAHASKAPKHRQVGVSPSFSGLLARLAAIEKTGKAKNLI